MTVFNGFQLLTLRKLGLLASDSFRRIGSVMVVRMGRTGGGARVARGSVAGACSAIAAAAAADDDDADKAASSVLCC